eukprot:3002051-Alexandrium_andersonii.AAC.1
MKSTSCFISSGRYLGKDVTFSVCNVHMSSAGTGPGFMASPSGYHTRRSCARTCTPGGHAVCSWPLHQP